MHNGIKPTDKSGESADIGGCPLIGAPALRHGYFIESYGCQMNDYDSERLAGMLSEMGYAAAKDKSEADFIIFNTCCVREHAEKRVFGNIGALKKQKDENPNLIIGVCGCMMQQKEVAQRMFKRFPFVDLVFGTHELHRFPDMLNRVIAGERVLSACDEDDIPEGLPILRRHPFSTNIVLMYGCNNFCTYCVVPYVRGRERSRTPEDILKEARSVADAGYKEITLLGQNVNSYSSDEGYDFADILRLVNDVPGIERIRFMTSHPKDLSDKLIDSMAELKNVCNHIHLPVQSGSDRILKMMNRRYDREHYLGLVEKLRSRVEGIEITTDIIVGFPSETEADFADTLSLVKDADFAAAYTFKYSRRPNTPAADMDEQVPEEEKKRRLQELNSLCAETLGERNKLYIGHLGTVLVEGMDTRGNAGPMAFGKLPNAKMVYFPAEKDMTGQTVTVRVTGVTSNSLTGAAETPINQ